ncbi:MAG TPA: hypothetical protein PLB90_05995 [Opitutaceae bacterium]|nr:hypothetical protein [Opitutaceae bacterium]
MKLDLFLRLRTAAILFAAALALGVAVTAARANPVKYVLDHDSYSTAPSGWFIYDRDTGTLSDYSITFYPLVTTFTFPTGQYFGGNSAGFSFKDETTTSSGGQNYDVFLGSFQPWFESIPHDPVWILFNSADSRYDGTIYAPIYFLNTSGGSSGVERRVGNFHSVGSVNQSVPEHTDSGAMLILGLGLMTWIKRRRN